MTCDAVQLKDLLEERKAELSASYDRLLQHIADAREQVCFRMTKLLLLLQLKLLVADLPDCEL